MSGETYADRILREVSAMANGGLEADAVEKAITDACGALQKQMAPCAVDYGQSEHRVSCPSCGVKHTLVLPVPNATEIARATSHTTKALDELYRLLQFAKGHPDSRPDFGEWPGYSPPSSFRRSRDGSTRLARALSAKEDGHDAPHPTARRAVHACGRVRPAHPAPRRPLGHAAGVEWRGAVVRGPVADLGIPPREPHQPRDRQRWRRGRRQFRGRGLFRSRDRRPVQPSGGAVAVQCGDAEPAELQHGARSEE